MRARERQTADRRVRGAAGSRVRRARRGAFSTLTVFAIAGMILATTVPINLLITPAELAAAYAPAVTTTAAVVPQELRVTSGGADVPISRDQYTVTSLRKKLAVISAGRAAAFSNDPSWRIQWPFSAGVPMSDQFGPRVLCSTCGVSHHRGTDFLPGRGAPVQAITEGVVRYVEESDRGLGVHVIIDHRIDGQLVSSVYAHMEFGSVAVVPGETVSVGQLVGTVGDTGFSFGPHLHFEIRLNGTQNVDPVAWLSANAG